MAEEESERLLLATQTIGLSVSSDQIKQLVAYLDLLEKWNRTYNLTAIKDRRAMFDRHLVSVDTDHRILIARDRLPAAAQALIVPDGKLILPQSMGQYPHPAYLAHHRARFKG